MRFWDSSALVPLLFDEASTPSMRLLLRTQPQVHVWWATETECMAAVARIEREGNPTARIADALARIEAIRNDWIEVEPSDDVRQTARRLLRVHPIRAADSLQLAAAISLAGAAPSPVSFVCLDARLRDAAGREGFPILPAPNARGKSRSRRS